MVLNVTFAAPCGYTPEYQSKLGKETKFFRSPQASSSTIWTPPTIENIRILRMVQMRYVFFKTQVITPKRNLFAESMKGVDDMRQERLGKITLRTHEVEARPPLSIDADLIRETRMSLQVSRAVFARRLRVSTRTLENWEQGRAKPNAQAAALILMVRKYPDTLDKLQTLDNGACAALVSFRDSMPGPTGYAATKASITSAVTASAARPSNRSATRRQAAAHSALASASSAAATASG
jgi:putative transcriptional regulator